jgi:hypothetical protein
MLGQIGEILEKFTSRQRIIALLVLLLSVVIISLGPDLIQNNDCKEVLQQIESQRGELLRLNSEIIDVQTRCTNERLKREQEISGILCILETEVNRIESQTKSMSMQMVQETVPAEINTEDTVVFEASPRRKIRNQPTPDFVKLKGMIHDIQMIVDSTSN